MHIIVLGADGRLSQAVSRAALEAEHAVTGVTRSGRMRRPIEGVSVRAADALNEAALVAACRDADVVFNGLNPPYPRWSAAALPMARNVLAACRAANAGQLFAGNVYNHGEAMPERLMPDTPQRPSTRKGRIRAEMEALFEAAAPEVATTVLRAGDFFGGTVAGSWFDLAVAKDVDKGRVTHPGPRDRVHAWAFLPDLARAFVRLAEANLPGFHRFGFEGHAMTGGELHAALEAAAGRPLKAKEMPWPLLRVLGWVQPAMREVCEMEYLWRVPHRLDGTALEAAVGPLTHSPRDEAVAAALRDLRTSDPER